MKKFSRVVLILSTLLFLASLTQYAYLTEGGSNDGGDRAWVLFLFGWLGTLSTGAGISWLANPLLIIAWITFYKEKKIALPLSLGAVVMAASFLFFKTIITDEAGHEHAIISYCAGYWLWLSSCIVCFAGVLIHSIMKKSEGVSKVI